ncbi:unnamed protein product [Effrenium voratum]|nr:unnamed protein product [Effrenium voratum]
MGLVASRQKRKGRLALAATSALAFAVPRPERHASQDVTQEVIRIVKQECPSFSGAVSADTQLSLLEAEADSLDTLEAMMELEDHFKVELEDEWMEQVQTVQDLADLIWRTPRGLKLRTVDDETYIAMIRKSHAENRWGELYDGWEQDIPSQFEHRGPSLAEVAAAEEEPAGAEVPAGKEDPAGAEAGRARCTSAPIRHLTDGRLSCLCRSFGRSCAIWASMMQAPRQRYWRG